ncbi:uncharacterized protein VTP21DRAFT_11129 [Calcarisporiella thermophila]|uniref:uncharacterized protein n=1 Tax=Calcarisporiella thermophila TaxID=911321 RepID=UPI003742F1A9
MKQSILLVSALVGMTALSQAAPLEKSSTESLPIDKRQLDILGKLPIIGALLVSSPNNTSATPTADVPQPTGTQYPQDIQRQVDPNQAADAVQTPEPSTVIKAQDPAQQASPASKGLLASLLGLSKRGFMNDDPDSDDEPPGMLREKVKGKHGKYEKEDLSKPFDGDDDEDEDEDAEEEEEEEVVHKKKKHHVKMPYYDPNNVPNPLNNVMRVIPQLPHLKKRQLPALDALPLLLPSNPTTTTAAAAPSHQPEAAPVENPQNVKVKTIKEKPAKKKPKQTKKQKENENEDEDEDSYDRERIEEDEEGDDDEDDGAMVEPQPYAYPVPNPLERLVHLATF